MFKITTREKVAFIIIVLVFIAFVIFKWASSPQISGAWYQPFPSPVCDNGEHVGNPHCSPTPTATPSPTPTVEPSASDNPCWQVDLDEIKEWNEVNPCPSDSPTPTPDASATPTPQGNGGSGVSDGHSDGLGCASHPCYDGAKAYVAPSGAPATGRGSDAN